MGDLWFCEMESSKKVVVYSASGWTTPLGSWIAVKIAQLWGGHASGATKWQQRFPLQRLGTAQLSLTTQAPEITRSISLNIGQQLGTNSLCCSSGRQRVCRRQPVRSPASAFRELLAVDQIFHGGVTTSGIPKVCKLVSRPIWSKPFRSLSRGVLVCHCIAVRT
jgi:hypothetical protein